MSRGKKGQMVQNKVVGTAIAIAVLVVVISIYLTLKNKGVNWLNLIKNFIGG